MKLNFNDLSSKGAGFRWGQSRSYANKLSSNDVGVNGNSWLQRQNSYVRFDAGSSGTGAVVVGGGVRNTWFKSNGSGGFTPEFTSRAGLKVGSGGGEVSLVLRDGSRKVFYGNGSSVPAALIGKLKRIVDRAGNTATASYDSAHRLQSMVMVEGSGSTAYHYTYVAGAGASDRMASVTHQVNGTNVERVTYGYLTGSGGDLEEAVVETWDAASSSWKVSKKSYYRYYTGSGGGGFAHGLKYVVGPEACAKMQRDGINPKTATDTQLDGYADYYFEYDAQRRVALERVHGGSAAQTFAFSYFESSLNPTFNDVNDWNTRTIETQGDGSKKTVYTNKAGRVILSKFENASGTEKWYRYFRYNSDGRIELKALPSAVDAVEEPVDANDPLVVTLKEDEGLVYVYDYYADTVPSLGEAAGYLKSVSVKKGEDVDAILLSKKKYGTYTIDGVSVHPVIERIQYTEEGQSEATAPKWKYHYTYHGGGSTGASLGTITEIEDNPYNQVAADTVIEQAETTYDAGGNAVLAASSQRLHDATGLGPLNGPIGSQPRGRRSYVASWPDAIGRIRYAADYGTFGGAALSRPAVAPAPSDTVLVTRRCYTDDGEANALIDPNGIETRWENDDAGRRIKLVENHVEGGTGADENRTTEYAYAPDGGLATLTLRNAVTGDQVTRWVYGTTLADSEIASSALRRAKIYPGSDDTTSPLGDGPDGIYERVELSYNRQGQAIAVKDPNATVHAYLYDKFGRLLHDRVTTFGADIDQEIKRLSRAYDPRGLLERVGSYDSATVGAGSLENEVVFEYDDFGNLAKDRQSHAGAVGSSTPAVAYAHEDGFYNNTRLTAMTYPNGRVVQMGYGTTGGRDDLLSRIASVKIQGESHDAVTYRFAGLARYLAIRYPQPGVELDYVKATGDPFGDGGDPYTGYDRFGRTVDMRWKSTADGSMRDRVQYGYDRASNRKWRQDLVATNGQDQFYAYDGLYQVSAADRGYLNINRTAIGAIPATTEDFAYDPTGNWTGYVKTADGTTTLDQSRTSNVDNQLTQIDGSSALLAYDLAGNATKVPPGTGGDWSKCFQPVWDAWNRLVEVKDELGATVQKNAYDGLTRRITVEAGGTVTHTYWSRRWKPLEERTGSSTAAARQYLWGERPGHRDELVLRDRDTDGNGTLDERLYATMDYFNGTSVMNTSGTVLERYAYSAFGVRRIMAPDYTPRSSSNYAWDFGFQGQFRDSATGWSNYGYRFYVPELGRWINRDPIHSHQPKHLTNWIRTS